MSSSVITPPLEVWELLRDPILAFYQDGSDVHKLEGILSVINNSLHAKKNWYVPFTKGFRQQNQDLQTQQDEQHTAFCTWLLGRLFCILGRDSLSSTHKSCVKAQIEILKVCAENQFMIRSFFLEYVTCLTDLLSLQTSEHFLSNGPQLLQRFTPLPLKALESLNLVPKYILIKSESLILSLQKHIVEIIDSMIPDIVLQFGDLVEKCWTVLCQMAQVVPLQLKSAILKTFSKIISAGCSSNRTAWAELCHALSAVMMSLSQPVSNLALAGSKIVETRDLVSCVGELVDAIIASGRCASDVSRNKDLLTILHLVIIMWDVEGNGGLEAACNNITKLLDVLPRDSVNPDSFSFLLKKRETQRFAVRVLEKCICNEVVGLAWSSPQYQTVPELERSPKDANPISLHVDAVLSFPMWSALCSQMWEEVTDIQTNFPAQPSKQKLKEISDIVGKVESVIRCAASIGTMFLSCKEARKTRACITFFPDKIKDFISFVCFLVQQLVSLRASGSTIWFSEEIFKSIILAIRYFFLLPEVCSKEVDDVENVLAVASIPWMDKYENSDVLQRFGFSQVLHLFPECKREEMRIISLHALTNMPCRETGYLKSAVREIISSLNDPSNERFIIAAIRALPVLLLDHSQQPSDLLRNLLLPTLQSDSEAILTAVSEIFSSVVCVLSGDVAAVISVRQGEVFRSYRCLTCCKGFPGQPVGARNVLKTCSEILNNFITLLTCKVVAVRRNMASSLGSLILHLPAIYKPETVQTLMKYAEDDDQYVRLAFSKMVKFLIFSRDWIEGKGMELEHLQEEHIPLTQVDRVELSHSRPRLDHVLQLLNTALISRINQKTTDDSSVQGTLLATIVDIGCVPLDCVLLPVLKSVLACVAQPAFRQPSLGQVYLKRIATAHNTNVLNLYLRFRSDLCQVLVAVMGMNFHARSLWVKVMDKVVYSLGFESTVAWLKQSLQCVLPPLMVYVVKMKDTDFLMKTLELMSYPAASVIKDNFQYIYPYAFLNETDEIVEECVKHMEEMSGASAHQLIISSFKTIHNELLLSYYCKKERVEEGICQLIDILEKNDRKSQKSKHSPKQADIAKHLEQRFLGILVDFDKLLESPCAEESNKIKALQSLPQIIRLMGPKYITPVRFKVLSTLRTALRLTHCDFPHLSCGAWEAFIQSVDMAELGPLLGTVAASLLPLLDQFPDEISSMLECLVVRFEYELSDHISDLFFLPNTPALQKVYNIVQQHVMKKRNVLNQSGKLEDYLQLPLRFVTHDNVDIRRHGLEFLLSVLKEKQAEFTKSLLQEDIVHDDIAKVLSLLIEGCRDSDEDVRRLCAENLGMMGALDPGHLPHKKRDIAMPQITSIDEDLFAVQALTALAKAYQAARNTRYLDSFAVAIQELLKSYSISSEPVQGRKNLWGAFPASIQQVMAPLENSSYYMTTLQSDLVWPHPLFGTQHATTLTHWAHTWACRIVKFIEDSKAKDLFTVFIPSLKRDLNCVLFFLPFILLYAVISGQEEQHTMIVEEMSFIIQQRSLKEEQAEETSHTSTSDKFQVYWDKLGHIPRAVDSDSATHVLCAKTVVSLLDFLEKWMGWCKKKTRNKHHFPNLKFDDNELKIVHTFLGRFPKLDLAYCNYGVNEYARALMYLEDYLMESSERSKDEEQLSFLERIYAQLNEPDGIKGVLAIQCSQPKLLEAVVFHEVTGQHQEALACYELLAKQHNNDAIGIRVQKGMIRCCLSLDQPYAALRIAEGALSKRLDCRSAFLEAQAECFWRINNFENLESVLKDPQLEDSNAWGVSIGKCLIDIRHRNHTALEEHLYSTRSYLSKALSTASLENGSYLQGYPHVIKLHMLQELEEGSKIIDIIQSPNISEQSRVHAVCNLVKVWEDRLSLAQAASSVQESILRLRRCILQLASSFVKEDEFSLSKLLNQELGTSWLKSAEVARIAECYQQVYIYLLNAEKYKPKRHFIELAKLHWNRKEQDLALATLRRGLEEHFPDSKQFKTMDPDVMVEDRKICAEAKLLIARYNDENMNVEVDLNLNNYKDAVDVYQQWEKSHACLARYYDRISFNDAAGRISDFTQMNAIDRYIKSLKFGCGFIYHSMSRMLSIWLDYGKEYYNGYKGLGQGGQKNHLQIVNEQKKCLEKMNKYIGANVHVLPGYMFMTGFSQLVSRICHPVAEVYSVIQRIIVKLLISYPQQTLWMLVATSRSSYALRQVRCKKILSDKEVTRLPSLNRLASDFDQLSVNLTQFCQSPVNKDINRTNVSSIVRNLPRLLSNPSFSKIMVPLQNCRTLILPPPDQSLPASHVAFPVQVPHLVGIQEEVIILSSLQRPMKITFKGSDGRLYDMMCKNKDDLRLDARVMEFNSIVNKYLHQDPASRSRNLNIRTYSVVPLNESCGLIEWVPNLDPFRTIVTAIYKEIGCFITSRTYKKFMLDKDARLADKKSMFLDNLIPKHPPVFRNWFRNTFTDSRSWFEARKSYVHTLAVMSMVGYILGLGDRHGENILLDTTCGDVVHVDFNCLFNKGEKFECPERVPFRLTHNFVSAMGPTGVEGPYRLACEVTLLVLRQMRDTLLSVLQPFVYDPNNEPVHSTRKAQNSKCEEEVTNDTAIENLKNISLRLNGMMNQQRISIQLSVEGQTQVLIQEATSVDNLCQMYIGWGAYI